MYVDAHPIIMLPVTLILVYLLLMWGAHFFLSSKSVLNLLKLTPTTM
jgi:hypothetical protein